MKASKEILTELQEIAPFLGRQGILRAPFATPAAYFEDFSDILMNRIRFEVVSTGEAPPGISPLDEIAEISPLLARLKNRNPYQVPEGYFNNQNTKIPVFENITSKIIALPGSTQTEFVVPRTKKISVPKRIVRYAAAACIVGLIGIAMYNITGHQTIDPINSLTSVSNLDMANFLDAADVHWTPDSSPSADIASADFNDNEIHELFSSVPDAELEQYSLSLPEEKRSVN